MKFIISILILTLTTCLGKRQNLEYPAKIELIKDVNLSRPDKDSDGKIAEIKHLNQAEIIELLTVLKNAKPSGPTKFIPDYYIEFTTVKNKTIRIKVNKDYIKGYDNDYSYQIKPPLFLEKF